MGQKTESLIRSLLTQSRRELADAGLRVASIYRRKEFRELQKYKLDFAGFQRFRDGLPWYRRAFLLYKAANDRAQIPQLAFHSPMVQKVRE